MPITPRRAQFDTRPKVEPTPLPAVTPAQPKMTGTWSSPDLQVAEPEDKTETEPVAEVATAEYVRILHNYVGLYAQGSIIPASAFEQVQRLIDAGAIEYAFGEVIQTLSGDQDAIDSVSGVLSASRQTIPSAPWSTSAAHNLLGAHYVSLAQVQRPWTTTDYPSANIPLGRPRPEREQPATSSAPVATQHQEVLPG